MNSIAKDPLGFPPCRPESPASSHYVKQVLVRSAATHDIDEAFHRYDDQRPGLGDEFLAGQSTK